MTTDWVKLRAMVTKISNDKIECDDGPRFEVSGETVDENELTTVVQFYIPEEIRHEIKLGATFTVLSRIIDDGLIFGDIEFIPWVEWMALEPKDDNYEKMPIEFKH